LETARRAFPLHQITEVAALARLARTSKDQVPASNAKLKELLGRAPAVNENTFIVSHYENLVAINGPDLDEAGLAVFQPDHGKYHLIGRANPPDWKEWLQSVPAKP
jgi:hypothetical protein